MKKQEEEKNRVPQSEPEKPSSQPQSEPDPLLRMYQVWKQGGKEALLQELENLSSGQKINDNDGIIERNGT